METLQLYVKATSNYFPGWPLTRFALLSPTWAGDNITIPFGEPDTGEVDAWEVVGWTDLYGGRPCPVNAAWVEHGGSLAILVWGGNSGVRVFDDTPPLPGVDDHLPAGRGLPLVWIEDPADLPAEVLEVIGEEPGN